MTPMTEVYMGHHMAERAKVIRVERQGVRISLVHEMKQNRIMRVEVITS